MEIILHIVSEVNSVFLLNGSFVESASLVTYRDSEPLYVTQLPLEGEYLPYTVKIMGGAALGNASLCSVYKLQNNEYLVKLRARSNYVYSVAKPHDSPELGVIPRFFRLVKDKSYGAARSLMTNELSESLTDNSLGAFFSDYNGIIENSFSADGGYILLKDGGVCPKVTITMRNGQIDNLIEQ